jgi:hypothetical protein
VRSDLAGPGYHINRSNLLVLESKADMQKRGQASPDDGDALALTFAQPVAPAEVEEEDEEEEFGGYSGTAARGGCETPQGGCTVNRWPPCSRRPGWLTGLAVAIIARAGLDRATLQWNSVGP